MSLIRFLSCAYCKVLRTLRRFREPISGVTGRRHDRTVRDRERTASCGLVPVGQFRSA
jgi:hypothetical protein